MYYKRVLLGKGMHLFPVLVISATRPPALMTVFRFCWKRMVLGAQLMTKTTNKRTTYFQSRLARQVTKSSQVKVMTWLFWKNQKSHSHDFDFSENPNKVKVMTLTLTWLSDFFTIFSFFFRYFDSKKGPNSPKVCLKCKILTKWPFGTKRKRQNVFSRSPSKKVKSWLWHFWDFEKSQSHVKSNSKTFFKIPKKSKSWLDFWMTWFDFSLKNWLSAQVWL